MRRVKNTLIISLVGSLVWLAITRIPTHTTDATAPIVLSTILFFTLLVLSRSTQKN